MHKAYKLTTVADIARDLKRSAITVKDWLKDVEPALSAQNGRVLFYDVDTVRDVLYTKHEDLFSFMGYLRPAETYDTTITDAQASEDQA